MNIYIQAFGHIFSFLLGKYLEVELLGHNDKIILTSALDREVIPFIQAEFLIL